MPRLQVNKDDVTNSAITRDIMDNNAAMAQALESVELSDNRAILNTILSNSDYINTYIGELFYLFGNPQVRTMYYTNHMRELKNPLLTYGQGEIDYFVTNAGGKDFNAKGDGLLTPTTDDIKNYVYKVNSFRTFETTVYEDDLRMAFLTETGVYSMVTAKMAALYSQIELEEYTKMRDLISAPVIGGTPTENKISLPYITYEYGNSKDLMKKIRAMGMKMQFPTGYKTFMPKFGTTALQVQNCVAPSDLMILSNPDSIAEVDVDLLASAFHQDKTDWLFKVLTMDSIPAPDAAINTTATQCDAILFHRDLFKVMDTKFKTATFYNADNDSYKIYVHKNTIYELSPFYPAVAVCTKASV